MSAVDPKSDAGRVLLVLWATPTPLSVGEIAATVWPMRLPAAGEEHAKQIRIRIRKDNMDRARSLAGGLVLQRLALRVGADSFEATQAGLDLVRSWGRS